jgi:carboxyl-terminal processing protease
VKPQDRPAFKTDGGRTVYGGGGIQPDIQIAPSGLNRLEQVLTASAAITSFATQYISNHSPLPKNFTPDAAMLDDFKVFLSSRNIQPGVPEWSAERTWLLDHLKAEIVTQAEGVAKGDEIEAQTDPQVQAALRAISKP